VFRTWLSGRGLKKHFDLMDFTIPQQYMHHHRLFFVTSIFNTLRVIILVRAGGIGIDHSKLTDHPLTVEDRCNLSRMNYKRYSGFSSTKGKLFRSGRYTFGWPAYINLNHTVEKRYGFNENGPAIVGRQDG